MWAVVVWGIIPFAEGHIGAHVAEPGNELLEVIVKKEQIARVCSPKPPCRVSCFTIRRSGFSFSRRGRTCSYKVLCGRIVGEGLGSWEAAAGA